MIYCFKLLWNIKNWTMYLRSLERPTVAINSLSPLNVVDNGNLVPPLLFPLLPPDGRYCWIFFVLFSPLMLCFWAPLVSVDSYMLGAVYFNILCIGAQKILFSLSFKK